jgi:hypothetical protein
MQSLRRLVVAGVIAGMSVMASTGGGWTWDFHVHRLLF